jgi:citrate synthase
MKNHDSDFNEITAYITALSEKCINRITPDLYEKYDVKRGLRDISGKGVMAGLTEISEVKAYIIDDGDLVPCEGKLYYRGYEIHDIVNGFMADDRFGFEETAYLLLFGELPSRSELENFKNILAEYRTLPTNFVRDIIMKAPSKDMMNTLARSVLTMYAYDDNPDEISVSNVLRQCLELIALSPLFSVYGYQTYRYYHDGQSLFIHTPRPELSTAENILHLLRADSAYSKLEAKILDLALVLHAEHGGGNNSTFTARVVTSSYTDTYSAIAAALGSLKGPRHGGANIKVTQMFEDMKKCVRHWNDEDEVRAYLAALLEKNAFDKSGLIYGMGHAVYSVSDPRAQIFKQYVRSLSEEKGMGEEYALYALVERLAPEVIAEKRRIYKGVSANIDFYSGFVYSMLGLPQELYTPIFANARIVGWSAHRIEEILSNGKIIRPAYKNVTKKREYKSLENR